MSVNFLELAQALQLAVKSLQMYTSAHPKSAEALVNVDRVLGEWLQAQPKVHIAASAGKLFLDGAPVEGQSVHTTSLYRQMTERQVLGFLVKRGVGQEEIVSLLQLLILKPAKIEELGGPEKVLKDLGTTHIELTQTRYEVVREGDGGEDREDNRGPAEHPRPRQEQDDALLVPMESAAVSEFMDAVKLMSLWKDGLQQAIAQGGGAGGGAAGPAEGPGVESGGAGGGSFRVDLEGLGSLAEKLGIGESFPHPVVVEALRRTLLSMAAESQLAVLAGMDSLAAGPGGLRMAFQAVAADVFAQASASLLAGGASWPSLQGSLLQILTGHPQRAAMVSALASLLKSRGADPARIQEMMQDLDWDNLPFETKLQKIGPEKAFYVLSPDQTLKFLRELLSKGRDEQFLHILDDILEGLAIEDPGRRETVARVLVGVAHWIMDPGLPEGADGRLVDGFRANFGWEPVLQIHNLTTEGIGAVLTSLVYRGELAQAQGLYQELLDLVGFMEEDSARAWREKALSRLHGRLCKEELVDRAIRELVAGNQARMLSEFVPYLEFLGDAGAEGLVRQLGDEPDRHRRARLMEGIRATGAASLGALASALRSPTWYLVRNALNLLGELGDAGLLGDVLRCFSHADGRVRRAAVRAAWKLGGPAAEEALLNLLPSTDGETQMEVLFALGQMRSPSSVQALAGFLQDRRAADRLRHKAIEILGQIGHPSAIPPLVELLKRKGFAIFSSPAEASEIRLAAAKSLSGMGLPEATAALQRALETEPKGPDRTAMEQFLIAAKQRPR